MNVRILKRSAPLAVVLALLGCGAACAAGDEAAAMPLGSASAAPVGFVELCERLPAECLAVARPTDPMLSEVRDWAGRARWASVFQTAGIVTSPAAIPPAGTPGAGSRRKPVTPAEIRALKDERRKRSLAAPTKARPKVAPVPPIQPAAPRAAPEAPSRPITDVSTAALEAVSRRVNRAIRRSTDADAYGREDVWALPEGRRPTGDCEDYVLAKRHALIEDGVDPAALSIAIVRTRRGEVHAVLLVATAGGEQVLDNLSPWVLPWREAPYEWLERQAPGRPLVWVRAAA